MAAIVLVLGLITLVFGERIGINDGQGWDGLSYMRWSDEWWHRVVELGLTKYQAGRVLPSLIVYAIAHPLGVEPTVENHLVVFELVDLALLVMSALMWAHLALRVMRWRPPVAWVGFVALFGCFANARHALYDPVLCDPMAFALGMWMAWGYCARRPVVVWVTGVLGAVTWPPLPVVACVLLVLPRARDAHPRLAAQWPRVVAIAVSVVVAAIVLAYASDCRARPVQAFGDDKLVGWIRGDLLALTVPLVAAQLVVGWSLVLADPRPAYVRELRIGRIALAVAAAAALYGARAWWIGKVGKQDGGPTTDQFLCEYSLELLRGPVWGLVHHVVYFGPIVVVALLAWRRVATVANEWGPGAVIAAAMIVGFSVASESRQWIHLFPVLVVLALAATADRWTPRRAIWFAAIALPWSKLWLRIGFDHVAGWHDQPDQSYFMHIGPYASDASYVAHLSGTAVTIVAIWAVLTPRRGRASNAHDQNA